MVLSHQAVHNFGLQVIAVWSDVIPDELKGYVDARFGVEYAGRVQHKVGALEETVAAQARPSEPESLSEVGTGRVSLPSSQPVSQVK